MTINYSNVETINLSGVDSVVYDGFTFNLDTTLIFTSDNDCDSIILNITILEGIEIQEISNKPMSIYPNPTEARVILESSEMGRYRLVDIYGRQILNEEKTAYREEIDMSSLAKGIYFVVFKGKNHQIIKQ